jgi:hypothetical protein
MERLRRLESLSLTHPPMASRVSGLRELQTSAMSFRGLLLAAGLENLSMLIRNISSTSITFYYNIAVAERKVL